MNVVTQIEKGYAKIGQQRSPGDACKAYAEFSFFLNQTQPYAYTIGQASLQSPKALAAIAYARTAETYHEPARKHSRWKHESTDLIAKETGIVILGNRTHILGVSNNEVAGQDEDEYLAVHGNYHHKALRRAARGVLCATLDIDPDDAVDFVHMTDEEMGLSQLDNSRRPEAGFHYSATRHSGIHIAGAAGIMPTPFTVGHLDARVDNLIDERTPAAPNQCDRLSGYFSGLLALNAVTRMINGNKDIAPLPMRDLSRGIIHLVDQGVNLH